MNAPQEAEPRKSHAAVLGALGVVFGDIGTSPLYALRECFTGQHGLPAQPEIILGVMSMVFWTLVLVISIKYQALVLRADNRGEGGILALMALVTAHFRSGGKRWRSFTVLGIFGASLLLADAMITPAISVLGAVEGLGAVRAAWHPWILPLSIGILVILFANQHRGTGQIGLIFGPVMMVWFLVLGALGLASLVKNPSALCAIDPRHAIGICFSDPTRAFVVLGSVFLTVTGAEAMYADMGHFGTRAIRTGWFAISMPGLLLNYFGQGALLLRDPGAAEHLFYAVAPPWARPWRCHRVEQVFGGAGVAEEEGALAEVIEQQAGHRDGEPSGADRPGAEVAHVGVHGLGAGDGEEHRTEDDEGAGRVAETDADGMARVDGAQRRRVFHERGEAERAKDQKPDHHDGAEDEPDLAGAPVLVCEQDHEDANREGEDPRMPRRPDGTETLDGTEHGDSRGDHGIGEEQGCAEDAQDGERSPALAAGAKVRGDERHQGEDPPFATVVSPQHQGLVLDRDDEDQRPEHHGHDAEDDLGLCGQPMLAREALPEGV